MKTLTSQKKLIILTIAFFLIIRYESGQINLAKGSLLAIQISSNSSIITIQSPENSTYADVDIPFDIQYDSELYTIIYSLDGEQNIPFEKEKILTDLTPGEHRLEIIISDLDTNILATETVIFTIKPNPSLLVIISLSIVGIIGLGFIISAIKQKNYEQK
jgi:hypothetical protein